MIRKRPLALAVIAAAGLMATALSPVAASYPGNNGRIAAGLNDANGHSQIVTFRPNGAGLRQLTTDPSFHACAAYSADGSRIAYCANTSGAFEIWTMRKDGTRQAQLTHLGGFATFPDFSPSGSKIVFGGREGSDPNDEIYSVSSATGGSLQPLTSCAAYGPGCGNDFPAYSPDGLRIAFIHADDTDSDGNPVNEQVWVMNADGTDAHAITSGPTYKDEVPDWSPDGSKIAYANGYWGSEGIWVMDANGSNAHQLTGCAAADPSPCAGGDDFGAAWSPDGTQIAFLRDFGAVGGSDRPVMAVNADGSHLRRVTAGPGAYRVPTWQPVGEGD